MISSRYMQTKNSSKKAELQSQLKEIELQLKAFQKQFTDIKKRAGESVSSARKRGDTRKLSELRKKLGIE